MAQSRDIVAGSKMLEPKERMFCQVDCLENEGLTCEYGHVCLISMHIIYTVLYISGAH